jgi:hypothetical protein
MTDHTDEPAAFDPEEVVQIARQNRQAQRSELTEARRRLEIAEAREAEAERRAEEAHILRMGRRKEAKDYAEAEAKRLAEMTPSELAERVAARLRRKF